MNEFPLFAVLQYKVRVKNDKLMLNRNCGMFFKQ